MVQIIQAKDVTLRDLIINFGLTLVEDEQFFWEWQSDLPEITDLEKQLLDKVKAGYINLLNYPPLLEDVVRMAVLDPMRRRGNDLYSVLRILKRLCKLANSN
jgi:hypothetical protein